MHVTRVAIENLRCFRALELELPAPGWVTIAGGNASGKTSLLQAIAMALVGDAVMAFGQGGGAWVTAGQPSGRVAIGVKPNPADDASGGGARTPHPAHAPFEVRLRLRAGAGSEWRCSPPDPRGEGAPGWFAAAYGPYRRLSGEAPDPSRRDELPRALDVEGLFREQAGLAESVAWLRNEVYLRSRADAKDAPQWAQLLDDVIALLNDGLLPRGTRVARVDPDGLWLAQRGVELPVQRLSDGYRVTTALVVDLVRRMRRAHGERFSIARVGGKVVVENSGVVLIDEVEQHLHVGWQRRVGSWLREHLPNVQFIVATHSPFVCQAASERGLIRLPGPDDDFAPEVVGDDLYRAVVNGSVDEAVTSELFGLEHAHSDASERVRERVAQLEARELRGRVARPEEKELAQLRAQLPRTPSALVDRALRKVVAER